ncbi:hypothetical protein BDV95DRAFT_506347 [Massariosphaeria phaeospora]|uniref:Uncharacterized protein n=1 Tax=Massariosphaeria phaeospora TaxID=100035 RepID=A0A7C8M4U0_9PLEO|nr:hypothetical protein BDV95DRAFT_506347 [Massariosphaeria phaeospora]
MPPSDDAPRRDRPAPEDNPFIAFRRFADDQVSTLFSTVFRLPHTIARYNNGRLAREQCLFGPADPAKCAELDHLVTKALNVRSEARELYRVGDVQAVLDKGEELLRLDERVNEIRADIVESARTSATATDDARKQTELVEKVGSAKGQQWASSWGWGVPKPYDDEHSSEPTGPRDTSMCNGRLEQDFLLNLMQEQRPHASDDSNATPAHVEQVLEGLKDKRDLALDEVNRMMRPDSFSHQDAYSPRTLEGNEQLRRAQMQWRDAFEDLIRADRGTPLIPSDRLGRSDQMSYNQWVRRFWDPDFGLPTATRQERAEYPKRVPWESEEASEEPSYEYAHDHEDQHDEPPTPKTAQGRFPATELEAYERLLGPGSTPSDEPRMAPRPSILSTLTTTERTVAADGTVTTKVLLKKRFADGREESSETVQTQRGQAADAQAQDPWRAVRGAQHPPAPVQKEKKGWFWSH